jgi:hypothetical protein
MPELKDFKLPTDQGSQNNQGSSGASDANIAVDAPREIMTNKEMLIGAGIVIIGVVMFFFLSRMLVDSMVKGRKSPSSANRAGWSLFFLLTFTTTLVVFGFLGHFWSNWLFIAPMGLLILVTALMLFVAISKSK